MMNLAIDLAQKFGDCLIQQDYDTAYSLLSLELQRQSPPEVLQQTVEDMIEYGSSPIQKASVMVDCSLTEWQYPPMDPNDIVWLYISLEGEDFLEAVSVIVSQQDEKLVIRWLEWGRP